VADLALPLDADLNVQKERHGSSVKRLVGHSGPVYGLSFSHDNKYLLSCSEDKTGKTYKQSGTLAVHSSWSHSQFVHSPTLEHSDIYQPCGLQRA
jgi:WD40 repeat protein